MPLFMMVCTDKAGALELRKANRDAHLAYARDSGCVVFGGPMLDDAGQMCGSMLVIEQPDLDAARAWGAQDPYAKAGLFADVRLSEWKKVIG